MKLLKIIVPNLSIIVHVLSDFFSGPDITAVKSITKCIRILSPGKFITSRHKFHFLCHLSYF